ncbi:cytochrome c biogenesis CcdA family protein [Alicyclobacillus herbarius]|uniref:cytochrome c biogenesis CcdA family protein n=1 Tax=Alicyclobacillus herbarius TaxID=122960 RepID=UPI000411F9DF|nr:cytochrome c biogenesis protein CcdA [Alicyclobacillus herbarius]
MSIPLWAAFAAGVLSFLSPCTLPLVPSYLGYLSGVSVSGRVRTGVDTAMRVRTLLHALCFCVGLSALFVALGWGASAVGGWFIAYQEQIRIVGGLLIIVLGLFMAGVLRISWLMREKRFALPAQKPYGYVGSALVGVVFASGWTPCVGPVLAAVLTMVVTHPARGNLLMIAYALGFCVPFLLCAVLLDSMSGLARFGQRLQQAGGFLLVVMGLLLATNRLHELTIWLVQWTGFQGI